MTHKQVAAFFDLDRTLIHGDSQAMELRHILAHEKPSPLFYLKLAGPLFTGILTHLSLVSQEFHTLSYMKTYRGHLSRTLLDRGDLLFRKTLRHRFIDQSLDLITGHRQKGHLIILVSATPGHLMEPFVNHVKPHAYACTNLDFNRDGLCTGTPRDALCMGSVKADQIRQIAREYHLDLSLSHAYSDHHADLPFLESVGYPSAINPTPKLSRIARKRNWPVHRFSL